METFKVMKKKNFRKRRCSFSSSESDEDTKTSSVLEETKELQKLRKRQAGVTAEDLAAVENVKAEKKEENDPFNLKTGGVVDMKLIKNKKVTEEDIEQIGTSFAAETNRRDEDTDMLKYVEEEMDKRKGIRQSEKIQAKKDPTDKLYELPEHLKVESQRKKTEGMLSNQMLSGIPEVDLGIEAKIRNIEATEDAKQKLAESRRNKRERVSDFVPTNMAVNFVQHNRFNIEDSTPILKKVEQPKSVPLRVGDADRPATDRPHTLQDGKSGTDKATDDFHYEKFKKQMRR